ncbi:family 43 glycosylhydrolase [Exiguobacterium sp. s130]|uniref:family 43 glycosylhydrolase n=1 Tax=Exiguobacterium sp. s130 TaxID=2751190 RepID=UPI001BEB17F2|nr:family 43 glycosylhydrolase [Exiguobacterium sp. s130]
MGLTLNYGFPVPDGSDSFKAHRDFKRLGETIDEILKNEVTRLEKNNNEILLFSFFKSTSDFSNSLYLSSDGENIIRLNTNSAKFNNQRDPSIAFFKGRFYMAHTGYNPHDFVLSHSEDLVNWTTKTLSVGLGGSSSTRIWAPEIFVDGDNFYVLLSKQIGTDVDISGTTIPSFRPYITKMLNAESMIFENATPMTLEDTNKIDPCLIRDNDFYYVFVKDENDKKIEQWRSTSVNGVYTKLSDNISPIQETEGLSAVRFNGKFYLYADGYKNDRGITYFTTSTDLINWSERKMLKAKERIRHGSAFVISQVEAKQVLMKYRTANTISSPNTYDLYIPLSSLATNNIVSELEVLDNVVYTVSGSEQVTISGFKNPSKAKRFYFHIGSNSDASITIASGSTIVGVPNNTKWDAKYGEGDMMIEFEFVEALNNFKPKQPSLKKLSEKLNLGARFGWKRVDFTTIGLTQSNLAVEDGVIYVLSGSSDATLSGVQSLPDGSRFGVAVFSNTAKLTITTGTNITVPGGSFVVGASNNNNEVVIEFVKVASSTFRLRK